MQILAHGVDLVEIDRIRAMLEAHGRRFLERCFSERERLYAERSPGRRAERYAVRFAAKEACLKAIGTGWRDGISWTDVAVERRPSGAPRLLVTGRCAEVAAGAGIESWLVSLSHGRKVAIASVIGCGKQPVGVASSDGPA